MSRNSGWFRVYDRMIDSPQVLELNDAEFRLLVSLWCLASAAEERGSIPFSPRALQRRVLPDHDVREIEEMLTHLISLNLIGSADPGYTVMKWSDHQYEYASWSPEARRDQKRKERQADSNVSQVRRNTVASSRKTDTDADATDPDTETDPPPTVIPEGKDIAVAATRMRTPPREGDHTPAPPSGSDNTDLPSLTDLCGEIAQAAGLNGHDPTALRDFVEKYRTAGASGQQLILEAHKAAEWVQEHPGKRMRVKLLDSFWARMDQRPIPIGAARASPTQPANVATRQMAPTPLNSVPAAIPLPMREISPPASVANSTTSSTHLTSPGASHGKNLTLRSPS